MFLKTITSRSAKYAARVADFFSKPANVACALAVAVVVAMLVAGAGILGFAEIRRCLSNPTPPTGWAAIGFLCAVLFVVCFIVACIGQFQSQQWSPLLRLSRKFHPALNRRLLELEAELLAIRKKAKVSPELVGIRLEKLREEAAKKTEKCPACGAPVPALDRECSYCGKDLFALVATRDAKLYDRAYAEEAEAVRAEQKLLEADTKRDIAVQLDACRPLATKIRWSIVLLCLALFNVAWVVEREARIKANSEALPEALMHANPNSVAELLLYDGDIGATDENGNSFLLTALENDATREVVTTLKSAGAILSERKYAPVGEYNAAVFAALLRCAGSRTSDLKYFLDLGVDPNMRIDGIPALVFVWQNEIPAKAARERAEMLFSAGANPNALTENGASVLFFACTNDTPQEGLDVLKNAGAKLADGEMARLIKTADNGNTGAMLEVGKCLLAGREVNKDTVKAIHYLRNAADAGNASAKNTLGECYYDGIGVKKDPAIALRYFTEAAADGSAEATVSLGKCLYYGIGTQQNRREAVKCFRKTADGNASAAFYLGKSYFDGDGVGKDCREAVYWLRKAYSGGIAEAALPLGKCLYELREYGEAVKYLLLAAENRDAEAKRLLGNCHYQGVGVKKDNGKAVKWFREAAMAGDTEAKLRLGILFYNGDGVERNYKEAAQYFRRAATDGNTEAMVLLATCLLNGDGLEKSPTLAKTWFQKAADAGNADAMLALADLDSVSAQSPAAAVDLYRKAAETRNADAMFRLGECYDRGEGVKRDRAEALKFFRKAADGGNTVAMFRLGERYYNGIGVTKDRTKAVEWWSKAADGGNAAAKVRLGMCRSKGIGIEENKEVAVSLFREAAEAGNADAMAALARCFYVGDGTDQNIPEAVKWWHKAANGGNAVAMLSLGMCYRNGVGIEKDAAKAAKWVCSAAEAGNADAMFLLGLYYESGIGVAKDKAMAEKWIHKAAAAGNKDAKNRLRR